MSEIIKIFDKNYVYLGTAEREEAHKQGLWHETFHCWLYEIRDGKLYLTLQQRSANKKDFPNQFDVSAAGHLLSNEGVEDGIREVREELGLSVGFSELLSIGVLPVKIELPHFFDYEFCHIFLLEQTFTLESFRLQESEVRGLYQIEWEKCKNLLLGKCKECSVTGFEVGEADYIQVVRTITKEEVCAHSLEYFTFLFHHLEKMARSID